MPNAETIARRAKFRNDQKARKKAAEAAASTSGNANATAQNRRNDRINPPAAGGSAAGGGAKETFTTIRYGNNHGTIAFGQISKMGDVTSDVLIQASAGDIKLVWIKMVLERDLRLLLHLLIFRYTVAKITKKRKQH